MDLLTIETYNKAAVAYAEKFARIGPRIEDVQRALALRGSANLNVIELGCGDGRDALQISRYCSRYTGIDASSEMIEIAQEKVPNAQFVVGDMISYGFEQNIDIIFAFASLLHLSKIECMRVLERAYYSLCEGGIVYASVKRGLYRGPESVKDEHGERLFYFYTEEDIHEMSKGYHMVHMESVLFKGVNWLTFALKK